MNKRQSGLICNLLIIFFLIVSASAYAVNVPVITHVMGKPVVAGATQYANVVTGVQVRGNAESGTTIRLFRAGSQVGTTITDASGIWTVTFNSFEGKANYDADASDGTFTSARCPAVEIHLDIQAPYGYVCNPWNKYVSSGNFTSSNYYHRVYETGGTSGSGVNFSTASMTVRDITANTVINCSLTNDGVNQINFTPLPNDTALKVNGHEYWYCLEIADKAGNVLIASKTIFCDTAAPVTTIQKIYDPLHSTITGTGEPNPNPPDADGWVNYYSGMTILHQPTKIRGITETPSLYQEGPGTYYVNIAYANTCYLSNGLIDATGSFTASINSKFYTSTQSLYCYTYDSAYNYQYQNISLKFDNPCPDPVILKVYDPAHNVYTGTGETSGNTPDGNGFVNYFPNMKISTRPTTLIGTIDVSNMSYFYIYNQLTGSKYYYLNTDIDPVTGSFTAHLNADFWDGNHTIYWYIYNESGGNQSRNKTLTFIDGNPAPPNSISTINYPSWNYWNIKADSKLVPEITGSASVYAYPQIIWLKGNAGGTFNTEYQYATYVLPSGQVYPNVAGAYDQGDVWQDLNQNRTWDSNEPYVDMPARGTSDGKSFRIPNFLGIQANDNMSYSYLFYAYARSPYYDSSQYYGSYWFTQWTYPHKLKSFALQPDHPNPYRSSLTKPTGLTVECSKPSGSYSPSQVYGLKTAESPVSIVNALNQSFLAPTSNWTYMGNPDWHKTQIDLSSITFPQGTFKIKVYLKNQMHVIEEDQSNFFVIDNTAPMAQDFSPVEGAVSNSFTSFNARIVDPYLNDNSEGSGLNLDVALPQIWPFRLLTNQLFNPNNSNTNTLSFTITDGEAFARNHRGEILAVGAQLEVWKVVSGQYQNDTVAVKVVENTGNGILKLQTVSGTNFAKSVDFVALYAIPSFTSNNGIDRVGAVPISPVTEDAQYVCRVLTLDKSGNKGAFYAPYSKLELAAGPITLTTDRTFLFYGLVPPDLATFTSSTITTRKGNIVQDAQAVTVQRSPESLTSFTLPDANGLPGDGYQVYTGQNGATPGQGKFAFGVQVSGSSPGTLNTVCAIGLASGSSSPIPIVQLQAFSLVPDSFNPEITPVNPNGATTVTTTLLGYSGTPVPDGSLATWTISAHSLSNPNGSMYTMTGYHTSIIIPPSFLTATLRPMASIFIILLTVLRLQGQDLPSILVLAMKKNG